MIYYDGIQPRTTETGINGSIAPGIKKLFLDGYIKPGHKVLDYGAGKYDRNAIWLRDRGVRVYSYDPFNGSTTDGWAGVSFLLPSKKIHFDIAYTSFVLNVVTKRVEQQILADLYEIAPLTFHLVRNKDIAISVKNALKNNNKIVTDYYNEFVATYFTSLSCDIINDFVHYGVKTSKGFQRLTTLKNFEILANNSGWKLFKSQ